MKHNIYHTIILILVALVFVASVVQIFINNAAYRQITRLDRFFSTVSEEYRTINNVSNAPETAQGASNNRGGNDAQGSDNGANCVATELDIANEPSVGAANAPVTIVEYSDFECPFCSRFWSAAYQQIKQNYIDTGKARLVFKDFPLNNIHPLATPAAVAANCVYTNLGSEAFFAMHDRIFESQDALSHTTLSAWAIELGLSEEQYSACADSASYIDEVATDFAEGQSIGVSGTPSFVINGELLIGAQPYESFERAIEDALAGQGCVQS